MSGDRAGKRRLFLLFNFEMATQVIYDILKYSRSYPSEDPARFSTQPTSYDTEWQHFSNAKLQLCLDDASPEGYFRSAKVTILWVPVGSSLQRVQLETSVFLVRC